MPASFISLKICELKLLSLGLSIQNNISQNIPAKSAHIFLIIFFVIIVIAGFFTVHFGIQPANAWVGIFFNLLFALPVLLGLNDLIGWKKTLITFLCLGALAMIIESFAILSCFPYGCFSYLNIGPQLEIPRTFLNSNNQLLINLSTLQLAPWTLPLAFSPLLFGSYAVAAKTTFQLNSRFYRIILATLIMVLLDLLIDPLAIRLGLWQYQENSGWFGVPFSNFLGWIICGLIFQIIVELILQKKYSSKFLLSLSFSLSFWTSILINMLISK